jgi:hypothetical protein
MTYTETELNEILRNHKHWILEDIDGWKEMRADLHGADLHGANLCGADLYGADLHGANLHRADLCGADLYGADLHGANLYGANLCGANLHGADLCGADLHRADLCGADLCGADLRGATNIPFIPMTCPDTGTFVAWKKANGYIVKLEIPEDARRSSATGRECRCDKAKVIEIQELDGSPSELTEIASRYDRNFVYRVGEIAEEPKYDENRWKECAPGIHFFINRQEAVDYVL